MRLSAVQQLAKAQDWLSKVRPGYRLQIFDAYRPIPVQAFMVDYALRQSLSAQGLSEAGYAADPEAPLHKKIRQRVSEIWANPSIDPANPPPHATGAAVDLTVIDSQGKPLDMGCPIDDLGPHAESNYYLRHEQADHPANVNRRLLLDCMNTAGFKRLPHEWWHFSYGDAWWALLGFLHDTLPLVSKAIAKGSSCPSYEGSSLLSPLLPLRARYGRVDVS
jgi:D-alanyl-D-alanine dipeptidase